MIFVFVFVMVLSYLISAIAFISNKVVSATVSLIAQALSSLGARKLIVQLGGLSSCLVVTFDLPLLLVAAVFWASPSESYIP